MLRDMLTVFFAPLVKGYKVGYMLGIGKAFVTTLEVQDVIVFPDGYTLPLTDSPPKTELVWYAGAIVVRNSVAIGPMLRSRRPWFRLIAFEPVPFID